MNNRLVKDLPKALALDLLACANQGTAYDALALYDNDAFHANLTVRKALRDARYNRPGEAKDIEIRIKALS